VRSRWQNGLGETTQIAVSPPGAGFGDFDWRISTARVESDGPFSQFPGMDRTLSVLAGEGIELSVGAAGPVALSVQSAPFRFSGDASTAGRLLQGPITDLNVMTRRGRFDGRIRRLSGGTPVTRGGDLTVVLCWEGGVELPDGALLSAQETAVLPNRAEGWFIRPMPGAVAYAIELAAPAG